jgi:hypothetical protein
MAAGCLVIVKICVYVETTSELGLELMPHYFLNSGDDPAS